MAKTRAHFTTAIRMMRCRSGQVAGRLVEFTREPGSPRCQALPAPGRRVHPRPDRGLRARGSSPFGRDVGLIVEVAVTSLPRDLGRRAEVFARALIPSYWVADPLGRKLVEHRGPRVVDGVGSYEHVRALGRDDEVALVLDGVEVGLIPSASCWREGRRDIGSRAESGCFGGPGSLYTERTFLLNRRADDRDADGPKRPGGRPEPGGKSRGPKPLSDILGDLFAARGLARVRAQGELEAAWADAVGEPGRRHTQVDGLRRGVLNVVVAHPTLLAELASFQKPDLLAALRRSMAGARSTTSGSASAPSTVPTRRRRPDRDATGVE